MAQLKEIRSRIASITNTRQVTSAMKMVSAAKLKKAQDAILRITPYDKKLHQIILELNQGEGESPSVYFENRTIEKVLVIVVGANRGLCGGFNANVVRKAFNHVIENHPETLKQKGIDFLPIGRQVEKVLKSREAPVIGEANDLLNDFSFGDISKFALMLMEWFSQGRYQRIEIVYNKFKNAAVQILTTDQYLPIIKEEGEDELYQSGAVDYIFEPSQVEILETLIPQSLKMHLYRILLDSNAAEQGARMTAMHQATDNATDLLRELRTTYNNARQAAITNEILEITAGAEALKG
ncbi:MAG: ATP synthase F1 subunit gamma [Prolixibacteraceae bacterium]|nr:ATP synthase F1 subunit gamma [Prolixibacteraceae bacterium]